MIFQSDVELAPAARGIYEVTQSVQALVAGSGVGTGLCHVYIKHTSASLTITENADPAVLADLARSMERLVPDGDARSEVILYAHSAEGPDDMPAHIRSVLTQTAVSVPVRDSRLGLGTWQGIFLWEHRRAPHRRTLTVTVIGEGARSEVCPCT